MGASGCIFGLGVRATGPLPLPPGLPPAERVDVEYVLGELPEHAGTRADALARQPYVSTIVDADGEYGLLATRLPEGDIRMDYRDGTVAVVERGGSRVWAQWPEQAPVDDVACYLFGPVLGVVLRLRGTLALHASVVAVGGQAIVLAGPSGAGKSTTAAAFTRLGLPLLADDVAAVFDAGAGGFMVAPGNPQLRLWPDSADSLFGSSHAWPRVSPVVDKRLLDLASDPARFEAGALPVARIYCLGERVDGEPRFSQMGLKDALVALVGDSYGTKYLDAAGRAREFDLLARLLGCVAPRRVHASSDLSRVDELCRLILADALG